MQPICTYELRFVRERSLVSCLVMAPIVTRPRASRRLSGAGLGIDTESEIRVYDIHDADADSNGPGSTWGRTQEVLQYAYARCAAGTRKFDQLVIFVI